MSRDEGGRLLAGRLLGRFLGARAEVEGAGLLVPVLVLRAGVLVAAELTALLVVGGRPAGWLAALVAVLGLLAAAAPGSAAPGLFAAAVVVLQALFGGPDLRALLTALALHATWLLCGLAGGLPLHGRLEPAALLPSARRWLAVAAVTCGLAAGVWAVRVGGVRVGEQLLLLSGLVVLATGIAVGRLVHERSRPRP